MLTGGHRSDQDSAQFNDRTEDLFGVCSTGQILPMEFENEPLVLFLQQNQNVLKQDGVQLW